MIKTAEDFARLRLSDDLSEQAQATHHAAPDAVWLDVIARYPELKKWVAHNKTVPLEILRLLAKDTDHHVRRAVAAKRKLDRTLFEALAKDEDEVVQRTIANNAKCPDDLCRRIKDHIGMSWSDS